MISKPLIFYYLICFIFSSKLPTFSDYPIKTIYKGPFAKVNLKSDPSAKMFRTNLRNAVSNGINYAGHYSIAIWGCGTECQQYAIVNVKTGDVIFPKDRASMTTEGMIFRADSKLLILDPITKGTVEYYENDLPNWLITRFYILENGKLNLIDSSKTVREYEDQIRP